MILHDVPQRSPEWYALRVGLPTASEFSKIVTSKGESSKSAATYAITLAAELFAGKPVDAWEGNGWTERGREMENTALQLYEFARDVEPARAGFVTDDAGAMGCSPDALIGDDGIVEVKCCKAETHIKAILYHQKNGRCPTDYVQQTQGQLLICDRAWCDLIFYHPELPLLVIRQAPDRTVQEALLRDIPFVLRERDAVLSVLRERAGADGAPASPLPASMTDLNSADPVF
jgi:hypothetical protein